MENKPVFIDVSDYLSFFLCLASFKKNTEMIRRNPQHLLISYNRDDIPVKGKGRTLGGITGVVIVPRPAFAKMRGVEITI
jgi:hypothetical protein